MTAKKYLYKTYNDFDLSTLQYYNETNDDYLNISDPQININTSTFANPLFSNIYNNPFPIFLPYYIFLTLNDTVFNKYLDTIKKLTFDYIPLNNISIMSNNDCILLYQMVVQRIRECEKYNELLKLINNNIEITNNITEVLIPQLTEKTTATSYSTVSSTK